MINNLNQLAAAVCAREGKKNNLNVGEVKEVLRCLGDALRSLPLPDALRLCGRIIKGKGR
jgi:hypothetical protein